MAESRVKASKPALEKSWIWLIVLALIIRILDTVKIPVFGDELPILYNVANFLKNKTLVPTHFSYPTFFSYLITLPMLAGFLVFYGISGYPPAGLADSEWIRFLFSVNTPVLVQAGRIVSILISLATIILVYRWAYKRAGWLAALTAGLILAIDPFGGRYLAYSRFALPDITSAFLVTAVMICSLDYIRGGSKRLVFCAAILFGLAVSTKYNAAMAVIPLIGAVIIRRDSALWKTLLLAGGLGLLGFLIGSPGVLIAPQKFIQGYLFESAHMARGSMGGHDVDWIWVISYLWKSTAFMLPLVILTVGYSIFRHNKEDIVFLLLIIPAFLYIGQFEKKAIHYFLFLLPALAIFAGWMIQDIYGRLNKNHWRTLLIAVCTLWFVIYPLALTAKMVHRDMQTDTTVTAQKWIRENIPDGASILVNSYTLGDLQDREEARKRIQEVKDGGSPYYDRVEAFFAESNMYRIIRNAEVHASGIDSLENDYIIVSADRYNAYQTSDTGRIPPEGSPLHEEFLMRKSFYDALFAGNEAFTLIHAITGIAGPEIRIYQRAGR